MLKKGHSFIAILQEQLLRYKLNYPFCRPLSLFNELTQSLIDIPASEPLTASAYLTLGS